MKWIKGMNPKSVPILSCIVSNYGNMFKKTNVDTEGIWEPVSVFVTKHIKEVVGLKGKLESGLLG